jgi:hypothetical protein
MALSGYPKTYDATKVYTLTKEGALSTVYGIGAANSASGELVTNGTFDSDLSGWTAGSGWSWFSKEARLSSNTGTLESSFTPVSGKTYQINVKSTKGSGALAVSLGGVSIDIAGSDTYTYYITATNTNALTFTPTGSTSWRVDDVSVKEITDLADNFMAIKPMSENDAGWIEYIVKYPNSANPDTEITIRALTGTTLYGPFSYIKHNDENSTGDHYTLVYEVED